jgi:hypothetical protein
VLTLCTGADINLCVACVALSFACRMLRVRGDFQEIIRRIPPAEREKRRRRMREYAQLLQWGWGSGIDSLTMGLASAHGESIWAGHDGDDFRVGVKKL